MIRGHTACKIEQQGQHPAGLISRFVLWILSFYVAAVE